MNSSTRPACKAPLSPNARFTFAGRRPPTLYAALPDKPQAGYLRPRGFKGWPVRFQEIARSIEDVFGVQDRVVARIRWRTRSRRDGHEQPQLSWSAQLRRGVSSGTLLDDRGPERGSQQSDQRRVGTRCRGFLQVGVARLG